MVDNRREMNRKIARFREIIASRVNNECSDITAGVEVDCKKELADFAVRIEELQSQQLAERKRKIELSVNKSISDKRLELRRKFNAKREELRLELFDDVKRRLTEFKASPEYDIWLKSRLSQYEGWDISYSNGGGFVAYSEGKKADESFERLLSEQTEWFLSISGLERE